MYICVCVLLIYNIYVYLCMGYSIAVSATYMENKIPYSRKISRAKFFEVDLPQNSSRIKLKGSTRLSLHLYAIIRFSRINFQGNSEIHENSEIYCRRKIPAIRYGT